MKPIFFLRSLFGALLFILHTLLTCLTVIFLGVLKARKAQDKVVQIWGRLGLWYFGVRPHVSGLENLQDRGVIYLFNHQSHLDICLMHAMVPDSFRFGAKIELFKIPIFGRAMLMSGALPIARQNRNEVFRVYREAEKRIEAGESFILAPEGTRQKQPEIGPFKKGPFFFAMGAKAPVQPVMMKGVFDALPKTQLLPNTDRWTRDVYLRLGEPFETANLSSENLDGFVQEVREYMVKEYAQMPKRGTHVRQ